MNISTRHLPSLADRSHGDEGLIALNDGDGEFLCIVCKLHPVECDDETCTDCMESPEAA